MANQVNLRTLAQLKQHFAASAAVFPVIGGGFEVLVGEEEHQLRFADAPVRGEIVGYDAYGRHHVVAVN